MPIILETRNIQPDDDH